MQKNFVGKGRNRSSICSCAALKSGKSAVLGAVLTGMMLIGLSSAGVAEVRLSLAEAVSMAEAHSFAVASAQYDSAATTFRYDGVRAERFPVLSLEGRSYFVSRLQTIDLPFGSQEIGSKENYQADFTLTMPLYTGGRLSNRIRIEEENSRASYQSLAAERMAAAYRCRQAYLKAMAAQATLQAATSSLQRLEIIFKDVHNLYAGGMADSIDLLEAELAQQMGQQQVDLQTNASANAMTVLAGLIGIAEGEEIILTETTVVPSEPDGIIRETSPEINRPELARLDHVIAASDRAVGVERGAILPGLSGFAGYSYGMPNKDMFNKTWNDYFSVGLALKWEFNLGRKTMKDIQAARNRASSARMAQKNLQDAMMTQRDVASNNLKHAFSVCRISEKEYDLAGRQFYLAQLRQKAGQISINRLLEMEADLTAVEQRYRAALIQYYLAENEYLYAVGSGRIFGGLR